MRIIYSEVITSFPCIAYFYFKNVVKETAYKNVAFLVFRASQLVFIRGKIFFTKIGPLDILASLYFETTRGVYVFLVNKAL